MRKLAPVFLGLATSSLFSAGLASASSVAVTATLYSAPGGINPGTHVMQVSFGGLVDSPAYVGKINWYNATGDFTGMNSNLGAILKAGGTFQTFCIEGTQNVYFGATETWNDGVVDLSEAPNPGSHFSLAQQNALVEFYNRFYDSATTDTSAAAFQLGLWEIAGDGLTANPFATGFFQASLDPAATDLATTWLSLVGSSAYTTKYTVYALTDSQIQDQIFGVPTGGAGTPLVPLPAALPGGLALIGCLGVTRYFRRNRSL